MNNSRYHILGEVGQGQFGQVFCASDRLTGQLVALKKLESRRFPTHRFLRELAVLVRLQHPNIVGLQGLEYTATGRYLVIDYCQGGTLRQLMESKVELSLVQKLEIVRDILLGLEHVHDNQIIHCDLKPENILLKVIQQGWSAQIADFGVAHFQEPNSSQDSSSGHTGSPAYMAPERFYGSYAPESDLYAIGVLLFELVVGRRPFSGMPADIMKAHLNQPLRIPKSIPSSLKLVLNKALQKLPQNRYSSAASMRMMLEAVIADIETMKSRPSRWTEPKVPREQIEPSEVTQPLPHSAGSREISFALDQLQPYLTVEGSIQALWLRPQGCFLAIDDNQELSLGVINPSASLHSLMSFPTLAGDLNAQKAHPRNQIDLDPQGRRLAILRPQSTTTSSTLDSTASSLSSLQILDLSAEQDCKRHWTLEADQLWFASSRHLLISRPSAISPSPDNPGETTLQLWSRRGQCYWSHSLPAPIRQSVQVSKNCIFAVTDEDEPMGLWIDLLPFRIRQVALNATADWVGVTRWGYVLVNQTGHILYLNRRGRRMAQTNLPLLDGSLVSAATTAKDSKLLWLAVQCETQSTLYTLDLSAQLPKVLLTL